MGIHDAIEARDLDALRRGLADGGDANACDAEGDCALAVAVGCGWAEGARLLLEHGAHPEGSPARDGTPLLMALTMDDLPMVRLLLDAGAVGDAQAWRDTPLTIAAGHGALEIVRLLLERGASPDGPNAAGETPLSFAIVGGHAQVVALLLERGADVNLPVDGEPPLLRAVGMHACDMDIVRRLLAAGADVNAATDAGERVLEVALACRHEDAALALVEAGAQVDVRGAAGATALELAQAQGLTRAEVAIKDRLG